MAESDFKIRGDELIKKVKELIREGNVRKIIIKNEKGKEYLHIPVNVGILGAIFAPVLVAVGVIAAMASCFTIEVVRKDSSEKPKATEKK